MAQQFNITVGELRERRERIAKMTPAERAEFMESVQAQVAAQQQTAEAKTPVLAATA